MVQSGAKWCKVVQSGATGATSATGGVVGEWVAFEDRGWVKFYNLMNGLRCGDGSRSELKVGLG